MSTTRVATHTTSMNVTKIIILNDQKNQTMVIMFLLVCSLLSWSPLSFVVMFKNDNTCYIINENETNHYWTMVQNLFKTKTITRSLFLLSKLHTICMEEETSTKKFVLNVKEVTTLLKNLGEIVYEKNCNACHMCWMHCLLVRRDSLSPSLEKISYLFFTN
jgi:hypothetical protein